MVDYGNVFSDQEPNEGEQGSDTYADAILSPISGASKDAEGKIDNQ